MRKDVARAALSQGFRAAAIVAIVWLAGCGRSDATVEATEVRTVAVPVESRSMLVIESDCGSVEIRGEPDLEWIAVEATIRARGASRDEAQARLGALEWSELRSDNALRLRFHVPDEDGDRAASASIVVRVPVCMSIDVNGRDTDVSIHAVSGVLDVVVEGSVVVRGGNFERLCILAGGDVEVSGRLGGAAEHGLRTRGGDVHVRIPTDSRLRIEAEVSTAGSITSALPLVGDTAGRTWSATLNAPDAILRLGASDGRILIGRLHET